jgi:hypothetical protein
MIKVFVGVNKYIVVVKKINVFGHIIAWVLKPISAARSTASQFNGPKSSPTQFCNAHGKVIYGNFVS